MTTGDGVQWLADTLALNDDYCMTFARGLDPLGLLTGMGCEVEGASAMTPGDAADFASDQDPDDFENYQILVRAGHAGQWAFGVENGSAYGGQTDVLIALANGTEAISLRRNIKGFTAVSYANDGELVSEFVVADPLTIYGADPERLVPALRSAGVSLEVGVSSPPDLWRRVLAAVEAEFGLELPMADVLETALLAAPVLYE